MKRAPNPKHLQDYLIKNRRELLEQIEELAFINEDGCKVIPGGTLQVELRGYDKPQTVSAARVVYAMLHPTVEVKKELNVVHMCMTTQNTGNYDCCITPDHLALDNEDGRHALAAVRKRELIRR